VTPRKHYANSRAERLCDCGQVATTMIHAAHVCQPCADLDRWLHDENTRYHAAMRAEREDIYRAWWRAQQKEKEQATA
jgi:hypothetical protein